MKVLTCAVICCALIWSSVSHTKEITLKEKKDNIDDTVEVGSTLTLQCPIINLTCNDWFLYKTTKYPLNFCNYESYKFDKQTLRLTNVQYSDSGTWICSKDRYIAYQVIIKVITSHSSAPKSTVLSITNPATVKPEIEIFGSKPKVSTIPQSVRPTGSKTESSNFLLLVVGAAGGGVLIITLIAVVIAVKRNRHRKGGRATKPSDDNNVAEVEVVDQDGQYESVGQMKPSVAEGTVNEINPMYESYEDKRNRNQNHDKGVNLTQGGEGDVYSVVHKPGRSTVQASPGVVGGDVYSVVQKKKQDPPATDGVQAGTCTPDSDISDVYSIVQKPGKTQQ